MTTAPMIRSVIRLAVGLLLVGVVVAQVSAGREVAAGVLGGGVVMFLSFLGGGWSVHRIGQAASAGATGGAAAIVILKLPILCIALWTLFTHFDPMAVVAGGSVVMISIVLAAALESVTPSRKEA